MEEVKAGASPGDDRGRDLKAKTTDGSRSTAIRRRYLARVDLLKYGVKIKAKREEEPSLLMNIFVSCSRCCSSSACGFSSCARCRAEGGGGAFSFGKSREDD